MVAAWGFWGGDHTVPNYMPTCSNVLLSPCVFTPHQYNTSGRNIAVVYTAGQDELWSLKIESDPEHGNFFARLQMNARNNLAKRWVFTPPDGIPMDFTMEEMNDGEGPPGTKFHRGIYYLCGRVPPWRYGYTAKKIIDENGEKVQPFYDQYLDFMGETKGIIMSEASGW